MHLNAVKDFWNTIDIISLVLVTRSVVILSEAADFSTANTAGSWNVDGAFLCVTAGWIWAQLILVLSNFKYEILIFVSAVSKIIIKLIPFLIISVMTLFSFGSMLFIANLVEQRGNECPRRVGRDNEVMCTREESLYATTAMFLVSTSDVVCWKKITMCSI